MNLYEVSRELRCMVAASARRQKHDVESTILNGAPGVFEVPITGARQDIGLLPNLRFHQLAKHWRAFYLSEFGHRSTEPVRL